MLQNKDNISRTVLEKRLADRKKIFANMRALSSTDFHTIHKNDFDFDNQIDKEQHKKVQEMIIKNALFNSLPFTDQDMAILFPGGKIIGSIFEGLMNTDNGEECNALEKLKITEENDHIIVAGGGYNISSENLNHSLALFKLVSEGIEKIRKGAKFDTIYQDIIKKYKKIPEKLEWHSEHGKFGKDMNDKIYATLERATQYQGESVSQTDEKLLLITEKFKKAQQDAKNDNKELTELTNQYKKDREMLAYSGSLTLSSNYNNWDKSKKKKFIADLKKSDLYKHDQYNNRLYPPPVTDFLEALSNEQLFKDGIKDYNNHHHFKDLILNGYNYIDKKYLSDNFKQKTQTLENKYSADKSAMQHAMQDKYKGALKNIIDEELHASITDDEINKLFAKDWLIDIQKLRNIIELSPITKCTKQIKKDLGKIIEDKINESDLAIVSIDIKEKCLSNIIGSVKDNLKIDENDFKTSLEYKKIEKLVDIMDKKLSTRYYNKDLLDEICEKICQFIDKYLNRIVTLSDENKVKYCMDNQKGAEYLGDKIIDVLSKSKKSWRKEVIDNKENQPETRQIMQ